ncbi:Cytochrome c-555 precursor [Caballeronia arationis]|jgi:mono/diheme cytochrome c family protein|uniref:Cytochrome c, mono- and diheme variants n=1 Tax=Caballeronia arationis TaxID=1777142 RepID=A0A7Z7IFY2_9BURK|nr:cytochrome c [Caballeronia arationis]SAK65506.1 Cytochrome c-555 precursor [Caballeronia arationis]SOE89196.1 Cytochrome c, mono- and diheme variants [Caballeronia arationis]
MVQHLPRPFTTRRSRNWLSRVSCAMLAAVVSLALATAAHAAQDDEALAETWRTLRAVDCARCHGKDYDGLAAPSIVDYARQVSRDRFVAAILDGNPSRGMPAYRDNPRIADHIDDVYRYFIGRAEGTIPSGPPPQSR